MISFRSLCCCFTFRNNSLTASRNQTNEAQDTEGGYSSFADNNDMYLIPRGEPVALSNPQTASNVFGTFRNSKKVRVYQCRNLDSSQGRLIGNFSNSNKTLKATDNFAAFTLNTKSSLHLLYNEDRNQQIAPILAELFLVKPDSPCSSTTLLVSNAYQSKAKNDEYVLFFRRAHATLNSVIALTTNDLSQQF
jgi:hypothetical protein